MEGDFGVGEADSFGFVVGFFSDVVNIFSAVVWDPTGLIAGTARPRAKAAPSRSENGVREVLQNNVGSPILPENINYGGDW